MPAPAIAAVPTAISEAASLAAGLITRTLKLLERTIAAQEESPTPPTLKEAATTIATIKRAADTLKTLAPMQSPATPPRPSRSCTRRHACARPATIDRFNAST